MLVLDGKRGIQSTLERVFQASGNKIQNLNVYWKGTTASINYEYPDGKLRATVIFPELDELDTMSNAKFNDYIAYALHELGHAWFTKNEPWDDAVREHGSVMGKLINGLEDPRIEQCVIKSGYANNSKALFETLIQNLLAKNGYVDKVTYGNLAFVLCVEGRRLNGYDIPYPNPIPLCQHAEAMTQALLKAQKATSTKQIVAIAKTLYDLFPKQSTPPEQPSEQPPEQPPEQPQGEGEPCEDGEPTNEPQDKPQTSEQGEDSQSNDKPNSPDNPELPPLFEMEDGDERDVEPEISEGGTCRGIYTNRPNVKSVRIIKLEI